VPYISCGVMYPRNTVSLKVITNNNHNNNNNNVGLTPDPSTRLMELFTDYHQIVTAWLSSPVCYTLVISYFSTVFCHLHIMRVFRFLEGVQLRPLLLWDIVLLSPSVCCPNVQGRILHWTQKSEYLDLRVDLCKYLPIPHTYALFVQTVIVLCANYSFIFKHLYT